jgi:hypothetical protein
VCVLGAPLECVMDDLHVIAVTPCMNGTRNVTMDRRDESICDPLPNPMTDVPTTYTVNCPLCPDGTVYNDDNLNSKCSSCSVGYFRNETMTTCEKCPVGTSALRVLTVDDFSFLIGMDSSSGTSAISDDKRMRWKNVGMHDSVEQVGWYSEFDVALHTFYLDSGHRRPRGTIVCSHLHTFHSFPFSHSD